MGVGKAINTARESVRSIPTSPEAIKTGALNLCHSAISTCKGSGSIKMELSNLAGTCAMYPLKAAASGLTACKELVTLHPIDATCTAFKGAATACTDALKIVTSPVPIAAATARQTLNLGKEAFKAPVTVPLAAYHTIKRGYEKTTDMLFGADAAPSANDNAVASSNSAPPAPPSGSGSAAAA